MKISDIFTQIQLENQINQLITQNQINIYNTFYQSEALSHSLYVKCTQDDMKYHQWLGLCLNCANDHFFKFFKIAPNIFFNIPTQLNIKAIHYQSFQKSITFFLMEQYTAIHRKLYIEKDDLGSFSVTFPTSISPDDPVFHQLIDAKIQALETELESIIKKTNMEELYKHQLMKVEFKSRVLKCQCKQNFVDWLGYCENCKEAEHSLYLFDGKEYNELENSDKIKFIDFINLRNSITSDFKQMVKKLILIKLQNNYLDKKLQFKDTIERRDNLKLLNTEQNKNLNVLDDIDKKKKKKLIAQKNQLAQKEKISEQILKPKLLVDTFYDVIINCESVLNLTAGQGWKIEFTNEDYHINKHKDTVVISFYGLYNKGKSFLASQLSNKILPRGYSISTIGLSALYPKDYENENCVVFLDSAGTETPICYQKQDPIIESHLQEITKGKENIQDMNKHELKRRIYEIKLKDRLLTEYLLQKFIINQSNIVIIVVDQLTKEEQRLIQKTIGLYNKNEIIIVHNFSKLVKIADVQKYINQDIIDSFEVTKQHRIYTELGIQGDYFVQKRFDQSGTPLKDITHVVMAFHFSEAGKYYNQFTSHYLKSRILALTQARKFDLIQELQQLLKTAIPEIIDISPDQMTQIQIQQQDNLFKTNLNTIHLKSIQFDLLGDLKLFKGGLDPKYSINLDNTNLLLQVELSGLFVASDRDLKQHSQRIINLPTQDENQACSLFEWHGFRKGRNLYDQFIILRGIKLELLPQADEQILYNGREKGEFRVVIPLNASTAVLKDLTPKVELKQGLVCFYYELQQNNDNIDLY